METSAKLNHFTAYELIQYLVHLCILSYTLYKYQREMLPAWVPNSVPTIVHAEAQRDHCF